MKSKLCLKRKKASEAIRKRNEALLQEKYLASINETEPESYPVNREDIRFDPGDGFNDRPIERGIDTT
jgi:hypothetical protein